MANYGFKCCFVTIVKFYLPTTKSSICTAKLWYCPSIKWSSTVRAVCVYAVWMVMQLMGLEATNVRAQDAAQVREKQPQATTLIFAAAQHRRDSLDGLLRRFSGRTDTEAARILAETAESYIEHDSKIALGIAQRAADILAQHISVQEASTSLDVRVLRILAYVCRADGRYAEAARHYERALTAARTLTANGVNTDTEMVLVLAGLGLLEGEQGKFDKELARYIEALPLAERVARQTGEQRGLALVLMRLAGFYHSTKNYVRSDSLYTEALRHCTQRSDDELRATIHNNHGVLFQEIKQSERARRAFGDGLAVEVRLGRTRSIGRLYNNIGEIFAVEDMFDSALFYQTQALRLYEETRYQAGLANLLGNIAATHNKAGHYDSAIASARRALSYCEQNNFQPEKYAAHLALADAFAGLGDYTASLNAYKHAAALKDTMYNTTTARRLVELETAQKEQQIQLLQSQKAQENIIRNALIAGALALTGFVAMLIRGNNRRKRDNARLAELNEKLFDANEELSLITSEKDEILNIVTHGLKSQIFGVRSLADSMTTTLAGGAVPQNTAPLAEMSRSISRSGAQMFSLVTNLLTVNTAEQGLLNPTLVETDIGAVLNKVCEEFKDIAALKNIAISLDAPLNASVFAQADAQMLHEVVENLVSNAVKYSPHGKNVFVRLKASNNAVRVEVADEGPGISPNDMKKLFGKFARLSARPTGGEHSTGLGLSIVKKMVEAMNGRVWCESELEKGATFIVELPAAPVP